MSTLTAAINDLLARFRGRAGVAAVNLATGEEAAINDRERFPTASSVKILVLYQLFREVERGNAQLFERVTYRAADRTLGSGLLSDLDPGLNPTLRDLAVLMMTISDNTATNVLIDRLGVYAINQALRDA